MLERKYDPSLPYMYVKYGRMSDARTQNSRSPDQQFATAARGDRPAASPMARDQELSRRRDQRPLRRPPAPALQQMLRDIEAGLVAPDLIVVDTYERLGRAEEIAHLRHKLFIEYGVMVVAADNDFADPTGVVGKAVGMVEQIRATENTRISCHNVIRGKKDAARQGYWPGGPPPFGRRLKPVIDRSGGRRRPSATSSRSSPVRRRRCGWRCGTPWRRATGWRRWRVGGTTAPRSPPTSSRPASPRWCTASTTRSTSGPWSGGPTVPGSSTNARVIERAAPGEALRIEGFCEAIVPLEDDAGWRAMRQARPHPGRMVPGRRTRTTAAS